MKKAIFALMTVGFTVPSLAGFPPLRSCSNQGATIRYSLGQVSILLTDYPKPKYETLSLDELNVDEKEIQAMPEERYGCASRKIVFKMISFTKKDGSKMPDAYNRLVQNGSLNDYFICSTDFARFPDNGQSCL